MNEPEFTWIEDWGSGLASDPTNYSISYGDGYTERAPNGLNADMRSYAVSFSGRSKGEIDAIYAFLRSQAGVTAFAFTPFGESASSLWLCSDYKKTSTDLNAWQVTGTFREVPA